MTTIYHDLTLPLSSQMILFPGDPLPEFEELKRISRIEGLDLSLVGAGEFRMIALPLKIEDGDGGPARVILIEEN